MAFARPGNLPLSVEIIAHRGASHLAPENTLAAIELAWEKSAHVEVDVHLTKDYRIVANHDKNTRRTSGIDFAIKETTYETLRQLDVGSFKGPEYQGESIPLLSEILRLLPSRRKLFVEIKTGPEILPYLEWVIERSKKRRQITIIGFDLDTVTAAKERMPDIPTYWLRNAGKDRHGKRWLPHRLEWIQNAQKKQLDGLDVHVKGVTKPFVDACRAAGLKLYVWTVDNRKKARLLARLGVTGITTNRPEFLLKRRQ